MVWENGVEDNCKNDSKNGLILMGYCSILSRLFVIFTHIRVLNKVTFPKSPSRWPPPNHLHHHHHAASSPDDPPGGPNCPRITCHLHVLLIPKMKPKRFRICPHSKNSEFFEAGSSSDSTKKAHRLFLANLLRFHIQTPIIGFWSCALISSNH